MTCSQCGGPFVAHGGTEATCVGYMSPLGHDHDDNCMHREYRCANKHRTVVYLRRRCKAEGCSWSGKATCWCHRGSAKVDEWPTIAKPATGNDGLGAA